MLASKVLGDPVGACYEPALSNRYLNRPWKVLLTPVCCWKVCDSSRKTDSRTPKQIKVRRAQAAVIVRKMFDALGELPPRLSIVATAVDIYASNSEKANTQRSSR